MKKAPNQKYCPPQEKNCSKEAKRESWRNASIKYRKKYKDILNIPQIYKLGTGWLSSKAKPNFDDEYYSIQKENKRLKINTIIAGVFFWIQLTNRGFMEYFLNREPMNLIEIYPILLFLSVFFMGMILFGTYHE